MSLRTLDELVELMGRLPGIGTRSATRLAFYLLEAEPNFVSNLARSLANLHQRIRRCEQCGNYAEASLCSICRDLTRDSSWMCVVARVQDLHAIERSRAFRGTYYVLRRLLAPLDGIGPEDLPLDELVEKIESHGVNEVIIATPLTIEGEATALYIADRLKSLAVSVSRPASGMPHGGEPEFTDHMTLARAIEGRQQL